MNLDAINTQDNQDSDELRTWFDKETAPTAHPKTAQEFVAQFAVGDIETSERRLRELRERYGANMGALTESQRQHCRQEALTFLVFFQNNRSYQSLEGTSLQSLINFAKNVITDTPEFKEAYPSKGLEPLLKERLVA